jgi:ankyrin repeat protein
MAGKRRRDAISASELSTALFASMHALACAEAQLHEKEPIDENETRIITALDHAMRVAHAACEAALTRVEPLYDADVILRNPAEFASCKTEVASALENANVVVSALEYASTQSLLSVDVCVDAAMRAAIDTESIGAVALGVVLLSEFDAIVPPRGLFLHALQHKNAAIDVLQVLLSSPVLQAFINDRDVLQNTVLMIAARNGVVNKHGDTVLRLTSYYVHDVHPKPVNALLTCPAVVVCAGAVNELGNTALTLAALLACPAVVASANAVNEHGYTALMIASFNRHPEVVTALLACPAVMESAGVVDTDGDTALMLAVIRGHVEMVMALLACPSVVLTASVFNKNGDTALMLASRNGNTAIVNALLSCPAVIESAGAANLAGFTALLIASERGHTDVVTALLRCPAVETTAGVANNNGCTALMLAAARGHTGIVTALLACPAVVSTAGVFDNNGNTALMHAVWHGCVKTVIALLACPAVLQSLVLLADTATLRSCSRPTEDMSTSYIRCSHVPQ